MKVLIVAATKTEVSVLMEKMETSAPINERLTSGVFKNCALDVLITGIGMVATTYQLSKLLHNQYDLVINAGICGTFNKNTPLGEVVNVVEDCFSELGAEDGDAFLTMGEVGLEGDTNIKNESIIDNMVLDTIAKLNGITVNTVHGNDANIKKVINKFHPQTESMEGAAFMFVCKKEAVKYVQIRAVSNLVEKRNKNNWNVQLAIKNLNNKLLEVLNAF